MTDADLRTYLLGKREPVSTLDWLQGTFLPSVMKQLNTANVRRRLGIYGGEKIPENERNLTDVRNRVSLIIEYETARIASRILETAGINDLFLSYVVANRFPDLEVRQSNGSRGLRIEVKCLQSLAEEKSANFDTLKKDIHPAADYVLVYLWEWQYDPADIKWDRAPEILRVYCFNAAAIAHLRDWYWLNQPPPDLGDGLQGFDLRYPVNCKNGKYNQEEGNYGKLLRIWTREFPYQPNWNCLLRRTETDYLAFKTEVIQIGFDTLSERMLRALSGAKEISPIIVEKERIGWQSGSVAFLLGAKVNTKEERDALFKNLLSRRIFVFTDKYAWTEFHIANGVGSEVRKRRKPKYLTVPAGPNGN